MVEACVDSRQHPTTDENMRNRSYTHKKNFTSLAKRLPLPFPPDLRVRHSPVSLHDPKPGLQLRLQASHAPIHPWCIPVARPVLRTRLRLPDAPRALARAEAPLEQAPPALRDRQARVDVRDGELLATRDRAPGEHGDARERGPLVEVPHGEVRLAGVVQV